MSDNGEIFQIEKRMKTSTSILIKLAAQVGAAKQVREYDSDRRKNLLAKHMVPYLKAGHSAAASETMARADARYETEFEAMAGQRETADICIATWEAEHAKLDALRSLLSMQKETMKTLEG